MDGQDYKVTEKQQRKTEVRSFDTKDTSFGSLNLSEQLEYRSNQASSSSVQEVAIADTEGRNSCGCSSSSECPPQYGLVSICGRRREMEDAVIVMPSFLSLPMKSVGACSRISSQGCINNLAPALHFFGVYDGHGGPEAALFCQKYLHKVLSEEISAIVADAFHGCMGWELQWQKALAASFLRLDRELKGSDLEPVVPETVGSTAVVAVVGSCQIIVANCGDSRAVLSRGGLAIPLSIDHKPHRSDEQARVEAAGGQVWYREGYRVLGILAMSRAIVH